MKRWWVAYLTLFGIFYLVCIQFIPNFPTGPIFLYSNLTAEQRDKKIDYQSLTNEINMPYWEGKVKTYRKNIARFSNVQSCLIKSQRKISEPDLRLIDWAAFGSPKDVDVCLWRIFSSLSNPELVKEWMAFHGLKYRESNMQNHFFRGLYKPIDGDQNAVFITGGQNLKKQKAIYPVKGIGKIIQGFLAYSLTIQTVWTTDKKLTSTILMISIL